MSNSYRKQLNAVLSQLEAEGWTVEPKRRHVSITSPNGDRVTASKTTADYRAWMNLRAELRRAGATIA